MTDRRQFVLGGALLTLTAAAIGLKPRRSVDSPAEGFFKQAVPTVVGDWHYLTSSGLVLPPDDEASDVLYDQILTRIYEDSVGAQIGLLIAYGSIQNASLQLHRPENCYPPQGYTIGPKHPVMLRLGRENAPASFMDARRDDVTEQILYWTRTDRSFTTENAGDRKALVSANLRGYLPDGVLVRLSTRASDDAAALGRLRDFNQLMLAGMSVAGRHRLLGSAA